MMIYHYLRVDKQSGTPIYQQLVSGIERFCRDYPPETPIPPERDLSKTLGVSRTTLRQALKECCDRGLIISRWAKGIFVAEQKKRRRILVMMPESTMISMPWNYTLPGIEQRAAELSITVEKISTTFLRSQTKEQIRHFLEQEDFTGILHMDYLSWIEAEELDVLRNIHTPVLFPHSCLYWFRQMPFPMNVVDERQAFRDAIAAMVEMGHTEIMTLGADSYYDAIRGYSGEEYLKMLEGIGANPDPELFRRVQYDEEKIAETVSVLLKPKRKFTAIICFSDFYAIMAMKALKRYSLRVPEDVSIMGFCGFPGGKFLTPGLSTIDFNYLLIGRNAVDRLLAIPSEWQKMNESERVNFSPYELVIRESMKPLKKKNRKGK